MSASLLSIRGAAEHNLQRLDLDLPHDRLIVVSGVSGSGKTSLVFDTIYAEARRRFLLMLEQSGQAAIGRLRPPAARQLEGLRPAVAIAQGGGRPNPRSTVATLSGVYDYLRLLFARLGMPHCTACGAPVQVQRFEEVYETAAGLPAGAELLVLAPHRLPPGQEEAAFVEWVDRSGYRRIRADGELMRLEEATPDRLRGRRLEVLVDRLVVKPDTARRLRGSLQAALEVGKGQIVLALPQTGATLRFSVQPTCSVCGADFPVVAPALFSFNSSQGACPQCRGTGVQASLNWDSLFDDGRATVEEALGSLWQEFGRQDLRKQIERFCARCQVQLDSPVATWDAATVSRLWNGEQKPARFCGVKHWLERIRRQATADETAWFEETLSETCCAACGGSRLRPEALAVKLEGEDIASIGSLSIQAAAALFARLPFTGSRAIIGETIAAQLRRILELLCQLGLGYLTLERRTDSLSRGEFQRLRLGAALSSGMSQMLYVLDEPSVGLHARDAARLLGTLRALRDAGNTVLVVEHDPAIVQGADLVVELGPGAGERGGRVVAQGTPAALMATQCATGRCLSGALSLEGARRRRGLGGQGWLSLVGARGHNLKDIAVSLPLGNLVCVTGVSGSGKSSLIHHTLYPAAAARLQNSEQRSLPYTSCEGLERLERVVAVDQKPIGRTPRSNVATYTGLLAPLRRLYAALPEALLRAYQAAHFSFNAPEGACPQCKGSGVRPPVDLGLVCPACGGRRYRREVLDIRFRGKNIAEILELSVSEARAFFDAIAEVARPLQLLQEVGLGYLRLGQPSSSFSGGEAQRVKLAAELGRPLRGRTLYLLDEPTAGLHLRDVGLLLELLQRLVDQDNTVVVVEHHLEFIAVADYLIDLGPEGGEEGGRLLAAGTPRQLAEAAESWTGQALQEYFGRMGADIGSQ